MTRKIKSHRWAVEVSMFGNREQFIIYRGDLRDFFRHMRNLNKQFHVYSALKIPVVRR